MSVARLLMVVDARLYEKAENSKKASQIDTKADKRLENSKQSK